MARVTDKDSTKPEAVECPLAQHYNPFTLAEPCTPGWVCKDAADWLLVGEMSDSFVT